MKKSLKAVLTLTTAVAMLLSMLPSAAFAATMPSATAKTAFLAYTDGAWASNTADPMPDGWTATDATVDGAGSYTVGLDFTGTADGAVSGLNFFALIINNGSNDFPGYFVTIDKVVVNGEEVAITKNYTSSDDKIEIRSNIFNQWVSALPDDARSVDGDTSDASPTIVSVDDFASVQTISVDFTFYDADGNSGAAAADDTAAVADDAAATTEDAAPAEEASTTAPKTGVVGLGIVYGLGALATGAVALKRKQKQ